LPRDEDGPVFREPWEAQAFALTLTLYDRGLFQWPEWAAILGDEIKKAQTAGDAAHAMSPVGGVGVNLAVQDAVAAANILAEPLRAGAVTTEHLAAVQERRALPMRVIQRVQVIVQNKLLSPALASRERPKPPLVMRLIQWFPMLRRIPARIVGLGVRPEHIQTPERA